MVALARNVHFTSDLDCWAYADVNYRAEVPNHRSAARYRASDHLGRTETDPRAVNIYYSIGCGGNMGDSSQSQSPF